eukprot:30741-Eustigmatos_ZCMA.PRE.1
MYRGCLLALALASAVLSGQGFVPSLPRSTGGSTMYDIVDSVREWPYILCSSLREHETEDRNVR